MKNKILRFALSLVLAFGLWLYMVTIISPQQSKTLDVKIYYEGSTASGYEADYSAISMDNTTVTVRGPKDLVEKIDHAGIIVDLTGKTSTFVSDYQLIFYTADSRWVLDNRLTTNVDEVRTIIQVNRVKKVPLAIVIDDTGSGMLKDMVTVHSSLEEITVRGSDAALEHLTEISLDPIVLSTLSGDTTLTHHLNLPAGVTCKDGEDIVQLDIILPKMMTKEFTVTNFALSNAPEGMLVVVTAEQVVSVFGPEEELALLGNDAVLGMVDCTGVTAESTFAPISYTVQGHEYMTVHADLGVATIHAEQTKKTG